MRATTKQLEYISLLVKEIFQPLNHDDILEWQPTLKGQSLKHEDIMREVKRADLDTFQASNLIEELRKNDLNQITKIIINQYTLY